MAKLSGRAVVIEGFPCMIPNDVVDYGEFYISYNNMDSAIYGCDTTALVLGQMQHFYILNGDHTAGYEAVAKEGLQACMDYFKANSAEANRYSERLE